MLRTVALVAIAKLKNHELSYIDQSQYLNRIIHGGLLRSGHCRLLV